MALKESFSFSAFNANPLGIGAFWLLLAAAVGMFFGQNSMQLITLATIFLAIRIGVKR